MARKATLRAKLGAPPKADGGGGRARQGSEQRGKRAAGEEDEEGEEEAEAENAGEDEGVHEEGEEGEGEEGEGEESEGEESEGEESEGEESEGEESEGGESEAGSIDWEGESLKKEQMLRSLLEFQGHVGTYGMRNEGPHPDDVWLVDHLMSRRDLATA